MEVLQTLHPQSQRTKPPSNSAVTSACLKKTVLPNAAGWLASRFVRILQAQGRLCHKECGRPQPGWKHSGRYGPAPRGLSEWYFHTVLRAHTTPGGTIRSTAAEDKSLVEGCIQGDRAGRKPYARPSGCTGTSKCTVSGTFAPSGACKQGSWPAASVSSTGKILHRENLAATQDPMFYRFSVRRKTPWVCSLKCSKGFALKMGNAETYHPPIPAHAQQVIESLSPSPSGL